MGNQLGNEGAGLKCEITELEGPKRSVEERSAHVNMRCELYAPSHSTVHFEPEGKVKIMPHQQARLLFYCLHVIQLVQGVILSCVHTSQWSAPNYAFLKSV